MLLHEHTRDEVEGEKKNGLRKRAKLHPRAPATTPSPQVDVGPSKKKKSKENKMHVNHEKDAKKMITHHHHHHKGMNGVK